MKAGKAAFVLIIAGFVALVVALLASPLFVLFPDQTVSGIVALVLLIGGSLLVVAGFIVRLKAPKDMPDNQYDHDLPRN
jgi:membrane protein implicated in regulation of membrane protease activity